MATTLTLTPSLSSAVAQALNDRNPFYLAADGLDLPVVSYDEEYAESIYMEGGRRVRSREQNPEGKVTLMLTGGLTGSQVRTYLDQLEQTVQACRVYGGTLALALEGTTTVTYDLESISLTALDVGEFQFERAVAEISVTTRPYGRLAPVSLVTNATSSDPIQSVSLADIPGSAPALVSATVTDTATQARDHLEVGLDADWDGSAALLIDSASLSVTGLAGSATTRTGAYSSNGVIRATLAWANIGICEKTALTHKGRHRVKARVYGTDTGPMYARVAYRVASGSWTRNGWVRVTALDGFYELDLGLVTGSAAGTLSVRVEAYSEAGGDTLDIDYLLLIPAYRYAKAKGETTPGATFATWDTFDQSAGNLDAPKAANIGGNWAEFNRTGANGFQVETTGHTAQRTTVSDASLDGGGCYAVLGSAVAACTVQATVQFSHWKASNDRRFGLLARYDNASDEWVALVLGSIGGFPSLLLLKKTSVGVYEIDFVLGTNFRASDHSHLLRLELDANGSYRCYWQGILILSGSDPELATGGTLASGKCGLYDAYTSATASTRNYDDFQTTTPSATHVIDASGAVVLGDDSIARSDGTRPPSFEGSYLTVPPAGREDRTHRLAVKMRRSDVDIAPDANITDSQRVDVTVTPRVVLL